MDTSFIILGVVLVLIVYFIFFFVSGKESLADKLDLAQVQTPITLSDPTKTRYSYELWMYVYGTKENSTSAAGNYIFYKNGDAGTPPNKNIGLKLQSTNLKLEYLKSPASSSASATPQTITITDNLPLQSWVHVIISVDNSYIDIYVNGKLVKSIKDDIVTPIDSTVNFDISKTYLAKFTRTVKPTDPQTAWNNYLSGNGENPIKKYTNDYNVALSFKQGDKDSDAWKLNILGTQ